MKVNPAGFIRSFIFLLVLIVSLVISVVTVNAQYTGTGTCLPAGTPVSNGSYCCSGAMQSNCFTASDTGDYICQYQCTAPQAGDPTPTPISQPCDYGCDVSGNVFLDKNLNGVRDGPNGIYNADTDSLCTPYATYTDRVNCMGGNFGAQAEGILGGVCPGGVWGTAPCFYDGEVGISGMNLTLSPLPILFLPSTGTLTTPSYGGFQYWNGSQFVWFPPTAGNYNFTVYDMNLYHVTLNVPAGYTATTDPNNVPTWGGNVVNFGLAPNYAPHLDSATISSDGNDRVTPGGTLYNIVVQATDPDGAVDIGSIYGAVNILNTDSSARTDHRGYVGWSNQNFPWWCEPSTRSCTGAVNGYSFMPATNGGTCGIYNGYGNTYIHLNQCTTTTINNTRYIYFQVWFDSTFTGPVTGNTISGWAQDIKGKVATGWLTNDTFGLEVTPLVQDVQISNPSNVSANGQTPYTITETATDGNGGGDIYDQYAWINYTINARGIVAWSTTNFGPLGNAMKAGAPIINCTNVDTGQIDGKGGIYYYWGQDYIYSLDSCTTRVVGVQRITTYTLKFDPSFQNPTINTLYGYVYDGYMVDGWIPKGQFTLANPYPHELGATISSSPVTADNTTTYVITQTTSDGSGANDILNQFLGIRYPLQVNARGVLSWSGNPSPNEFPYWGLAALKSGSLKTCTNATSGAPDGKAGIYADTSYGSDYINLVSCTTQALTSTIRRTTYTIKFTNFWLTNGIISGNQLYGLSYDSLGQYDALGWWYGDIFNIAQSNLYVTPGSIVLRYGFGATPNCSNGIVLANGAGVPNGTQLEMCATFGNNGTGSTGSSFKADTYINQATQPAGNIAGTAGNFVIGPYGVGGPWPGQQFGVFSANSAACSSNCRAALFFDRDNTIAESNETDNFATSGLYNVVPAKTLSGNIYIDSGFDSCQAGTRTPYPNSSTASVKVESGSSTLGTGAVTNNAYTVSVVPGSGYSATLYNLPANKNYTVRYVSTNGGTSWIPLSGFTYSPIDLSVADKTLWWCLNDTKPWFQVGDGDTRYPTINIPLPSGFNPSISDNPLSAFFSSNFTPSIGAGTSSSFFINNEYSYNNDPITKQGLFSYTFFRNRAKIKGVATDKIPGCNVSGDCIITAATSFPTSTINTPYLVNGDLTINGYTQQPGTHVLLLVNGNVTINSNIKVPAGSGSLFVLAAGSDTKDPTKGNINVAATVGSVASSPNTTCPTHNPLVAGDYSCANLEGIYSAEKSIILQSNASCTATPDKQLIIAGNVITNALKPFATTGTGKFINNRTLCSAGDALYPSFVMQSRYDFVPQLTDFYKVPSVRWKEVNP